MTLDDIRTVLMGEFEKTVAGSIPNNSWYCAYKLFVDEFAQLHNMNITRTQGQIGWSTLGVTFNAPEDELAFKLRFGHCTDDFYKTQLRKI
jgi:hypothetical protein